jgi:hypothetical protein
LAVERQPANAPGAILPPEHCCDVEALQGALAAPRITGTTPLKQCQRTVHQPPADCDQQKPAELDLLLLVAAWLAA